MAMTRIKNKIETGILAAITLAGLTACSQQAFTNSAAATQQSSSVATKPVPTAAPVPSATPIQPPAPTPKPSPTAAPRPTATPPPVATPVKPTPAPTATPCVPTLDSNRLTKILFLVDTSGSNNEWVSSDGNSVCNSLFNIGCIRPTDPKKTFRLGSIQKFFTKYIDARNIDWGFITFSNEQVHDYVIGTGTHSFTSSGTVMQTALNDFAQETDYADTPYGLAFSAATKAIESDGDHNTLLNPQYIVVLLTDGYPTDLKTPASAEAAIRQMLAAAPGEVSLSTIFYGPQNNAVSKSAVSLLQDLATIGHGQFANVNNPADGIDIDTVIPGKTCPAPK